MMRHTFRLLVVATVVWAMMAYSAPAFADEGCKAFGQHVASEANVFRPLGQVVHSLAPLNDVVDAQQTSLCE